MECPHCGADLAHDGEYGTGSHESFYGTAGNGIYYPSTYKRLGNIFYCTNREGFDDLENAMVYQITTEDQKELLPEDVVCKSSIFNGFFYTDSKDNLHEGYPC